MLVIALALGALAVRAFLLLWSGPQFPWSEDAAGHVYKSTMLIESLQAGLGIPIVFPGWYAGSESFRYWPHLPYFVLAIPLWLAGDVGLAVSSFAVGGLLAGGLGMLLWGRRLGWPLAILGAILTALLADPVRVAFAEGNLPRVMAHALFLPELALALAVARSDRWHPWPLPALALIAVATLTVLCHAMMAAAAGAAIVLVLVAGNLIGRWPWQRTFAVGGLIFIGTALAAWWLLPSLGGGIAGTSSEAVRRGLFHFDPLGTPGGIAAPFVRTSLDRADFHVGIALIAVAICALAYGGRRGSGWPFLVAGLALVAVVFDPLALLYMQLPLANLLWPIRLQSVGQVLILVGLLHAAADLLRSPRPGLPRPDLRRPRLAAIGAVALLAILAAETAGNLALAAGGEVPAPMLRVRDRLVAVPGWREATLDLSRLGSPPTLLWRDREQLFGWGIQGARNIAEIVDLNEAIERRLTHSVTERLDWWGVDDAILDQEDAELERALADRGFALLAVDDRLRHWHRDGGPRALTLAPEGTLAVGRNVRAWTPRFPQVMRAASEFVDDLRPEDLRGMRTLILAWPRWHDRDRAEALVRDFTATGGRVVVELSGGRAERFDGTARFLGVEALRVPFPAGGVAIEGARGGTALLPFDPNEGPWQATRYSGEIEPRGTVGQGADRAVVLGTAPGNERITFVGLNLAFHALITGDPSADALLAAAGMLDRAAGPTRGEIALRDYAAVGDTYSFRISLDRPERVVIPIARHERMTALVDGAAVPIGTLNDSVVLDLPAGDHQVRLDIDEGGARLLGFAVSAMGAAALAGVILFARRRAVRGTSIRGQGWLLTPKESQRADRLGLASDPAPGGGPYVVALVEITNLTRTPARFDPALVALVDGEGRPFPLAADETAALARALGQLGPGDSAPPGVPQLMTLVYSIAPGTDTFELVSAREVARLT